MKREQRIADAHLPAWTPYGGRAKKVKLSDEYLNRKICPSIEAAVTAAGLKDGMTISFHHAFRGGDYVVNMVMDTLAQMGFRHLTIAPGSLSDCHAPLVAHIEHGVIDKIYTSGLRGRLADAISQGRLKEPV